MIPEWILPEGVTLADAQFTVKYYDSIFSDGDSIPSSATRTWVFKTDADGYFDFNNPDVYKVSGDELYTNTRGQYVIPAGTIVFEETAPPSGFFINTGRYIVTIDIDENGNRSRTVYEYDGENTVQVDTQTVSSGQEADVKVAVKELLKPVIKTAALDNITGTHTGVTRTNDSISDTVYIEYALPGMVYTLAAELRDADSGEVLSVVTRDTAAPGSSGAYVDYEVTMPAFRFSSNDFAGRTLVVFEYMYYKGSSELISEHTELVEPQIIRYPDVGTEASDGTTGNHAGQVKDDAVVKDSVQCSNLVAGQEYTVTGTLRYQKDFTDAAGTSHRKGDAVELKAGSVTTKTFTADSDCMEIELEFIVDSRLLEGTTVVAFEDLKVEDITVAAHSDISDESQSVHYPEISTTASDTDITDEVGMSVRNAKITDKVEMHNLVPGVTYTVTGRLFRQSDGTELVQSGIEMIPETFVAEAADEIHYVTFAGINAEAVRGDSLVVYEKLSVNGREVTRHEDIGDAAQTVHYPEVYTNAVDSVTGTHQGTILGKAINWIRNLLGETVPAEGEQVVTDKVTLTNLVPGKTYTVEGELVNKANGKVLEINGDAITQSATIVVSEDGKITAAGGETVTTTETDLVKQRVSGTVELTFRLDSAELIRYNSEDEEQIDIVAYETLKYKGIEIAFHRDISDERQTIYEPVIHTVAIDSATGDHVGDLPRAMSAADTVEDNETSSIIDIVSMDGLVKDQDYTLKGYLVSRADSADEKLMYITEEGGLSENNADALSAAMPFRATDKAAEQTMEFCVESELLAGRTVVVFELLYDAEGNLLTTHADINDDSQSIWYPDIETTAFVVETSAGDEPLQKTAPVEAETITVTDIVVYSNTLPGEEYIITGHLAYTEDCVDADGNEHKEGEFLADGDGVPYEASVILEAGGHDADGEKELSFEIDPSLLEGQTIVAFEELTHNTIVVAAHADVTDTDQEVHFPEIGTELTDSETLTHAANADEEIILIDKVSFRNLVPGETYTIKGKLYDWNMEEGGEPQPLSDDDGNEITSELVGFVPEETDGYVEIEFRFRGTKLAGTAAVAFEDLYHGDVLICTHSEIEDEAQTVYFPKIATYAAARDGSKMIEAAEKAGILDTVRYEGLIPGEEYTLKAMVYNATTKKYLEGTAGEIKFTADNANGEAVVEITVDTRELKNNILVVAEELFIGDALIAEHRDPDDKEQTVTVEPAVSTGDDYNMKTWLMILLSAAALAGAGTFLCMRKRNNR